ncbi:hypothetical protein PLICRDRAFT_541992 [Plicaturopsis crispa FD-325 SS-3]|nr:hypothetical protein PLICRDRAFT_541992 [Plicaturopsis crispa FD-325 SS-3]
MKIQDESKRLKLKASGSSESPSQSTSTHVLVSRVAPRGLANLKLEAGLRSPSHLPVIRLARRNSGNPAANSLQTALHIQNLRQGHSWALPMSENLASTSHDRQLVAI